MDPKLEDILPLTQIRKLTDSFHAVTGIPASIYDAAGRRLAGSGGHRICRDFHNRHPQAQQTCIRSNRQVFQQLSQTQAPMIYRCPHGLMDAAAPIVIRERHLATLFTGQCLFAPPNDSVREQFRTQAMTYGFDANAYLDALHDVPVMPENQLHNILTYHTHLAALFVGISLERLQNHQTAETLQEKTRHLERANQALNSLLDHRQTEKRAVEENIYANIRKHVLPYVDKLAAGPLHPEARTYLDIIRTNLRERISPASDSLFAQYIELTPTELRVADLVRQGKPTKEIAILLKVAPSSVAAYRNSIRRKLGLVNSRTNLRVFLNSFRT